ncbi:hypothetical protein [Paracoccus sp. (in: a-proteobacteria)]|uniref:hypothetical protein n=1 Tax=Paracoccus sp. TaxID=267 RepID=UPI003A899696
MTLEHTPFPHEDHDLLMSVKELKEYFAQIEMEKAKSAVVAASKAEQDRQALIKRLQSDDPIPEKAIEGFLHRLKSAALKGQEEIMVARFPHELCTDLGRAINQAEDGWWNTLTGQPRHIYDIWREHLQPLGYHLKAQIVEWPNGLPGDVGLYITWKLS